MSTFLIVVTLILASAISTLSLSTYGLGKEEHNKESIAYQTATSFTMISVIVTILALVAMMVGIIIFASGSPALIQAGAALRR